MLCIIRLRYLARSPGSGRYPQKRTDHSERIQFMAVEFDRSLFQVGSDQCLDRSLDEPLRQAKSLAERLLSLLMLALSMPIILAAMFLVRLTSRGPAIYRQRRLGRDGQAFRGLWGQTELEFSGAFGVRGLWGQTELEFPYWVLGVRPS